jgi:hypothetical protein
MIRTCRGCGWTFLAILLSLTSCREVILGVFNPLPESREDAIIRLTRGAVSQWLEVPDDALPLLTEETGEAIPCQADDLNGDGTWDELFALTDLGAEEEKRVRITFVPKEKYPEFETRTNVRLGAADRPGYPELTRAQRLEGVSYPNYSHMTGAVYQMEGPAWENDRVGFRNYLDQRNGMDIFGKLTRAMVMDSVGVKGRPGYHEPAWWGMDILEVGTSLGAGAVGFLYRDSLYRLGDNGPGTYTLLFEGPVRSGFRLAYPSWKVEDTPLNVIQDVEISAGRYYYQQTIRYTGTRDTLCIVPGFVNMKGLPLQVLELDENHSAILTHGRQAEDSSFLAMAIMVPRLRIIREGQTQADKRGITSTCYWILETWENDPVTFRFYALWEKSDPRWASPDEVTRYLQEEARRWTQSVRIRQIR